MASPTHCKVALLGAGGLMGRRMAARLAQQGLHVNAWNRNSSKLAPLSECCTLSPSAASAVSASDVVLLMLADVAAIRAVLLSDSDAEMSTALQTRVVLMMSTIGPTESVALAKDLLAMGVGQYIEAPVLGSQPEAEKGTLQIMVGCDEDPRGTAAWEVLTHLGNEPRVIGEVGSAAAVKLALNQLIATETLGFCSALGLVRKSGADEDAFMDILRGSALYAPTFDKKLPKYASRDYGVANFPTKHLLKDVRLFCSEAETLGLATPMQRAAEVLCADACSRMQPSVPSVTKSELPLAEADYSAVYEAVVHPKQ